MGFGQSVTFRRDRDGKEVIIDDSGAMKVSIGSGDLVATNGIVSSRIIVTNSPQIIPSTLPSRKALLIMNIGNNDVYLGSNGSVSSGDGYPIFAQTSQVFNFGFPIVPYLVTTTGNVDCRIMEVG